MQDCYTGDIGDFGKYGLLRWLCGMFDDGDPLSLGVLWYHFECCDGGDSIGYLDGPEPPLRRCCPDLFDRLREIVQCDRRSIAEIEASGALPCGTVFFSDKMIFASLPADEALQARLAWSERGAYTVRDADLVFADPNNGLETPSMNRTRRRSSRHAYYDEFNSCWSRGQSLVLYQHSARGWHGKKATFDQQIEKRMAELHSRLEGPPLVMTLRFGARAYFVVAQIKHATILDLRIRKFVGQDSPWRKHFEIYTYGPS